MTNASRTGGAAQAGGRAQARKPNANSKLRLLSDENQERIIDKLRSGTQAEAQSLVWQDFGIKCSRRSLTSFWSWYALRLQARQREERVNTLIEELKESHPEIPEDQLFNYGQSAFAMASLEGQDPETWVQIQKLQIRRSLLGLESRRISILEKKAAQLDALVAVRKSSTLTPEEREQRMKEIFGIV